MTKKLLEQSVLYAAGTFIYVSFVAWFLFNGSKIFNKVDSFLAPIFMLLLLIISATITGTLVLGKPIQLYLDNHKKDAVAMLFVTLAWLLVFAFVVMLFLLK